MIITEFLRTRNDGVNLFLTMDAKVDENNTIIRDKNNKPVPTGFCIMQNDTKAIYDKAVDIEGSKHRYSETEIPIKTQEIDNPMEGGHDDIQRETIQSE